MFSAVHGGLQEGVNAFFEVEIFRVEHHVSLHRFLERAVLAGEVFDLSSGSFGVKTFHIAFGAGGEARKDGRFR